MECENVEIQDLLTKPREKSSQRFRIWYRLAYITLRMLRRLLGPRRTLIVLLNSAWITNRVAFEESVRQLGTNFTGNAMGISERTIQRASRGCERVLDVGCGTGRLSEVLSVYVGEVVGIDHDPDSIRLALARGIPNARFLIADITDAHVQGGTEYDLALLVHVLEHVDKPLELLRTLQTQVRSLLIEVPDATNNPLNVARVLLGAPFYSDADHVREYTLALLQKQLNESGWRDHKIRKCNGQLIAYATAGVSRDVF